MSGVEDSKLSARALTVLAGDGLGDRSALSYLLQLPDAWRKDESSPAWRHWEGANYAFVDGHVKWMKPAKITLQKTAKNAPTFLLN